jgi:hypothetical protein
MKSRSDVVCVAKELAGVPELVAEAQVPPL